jgi:hypothetical protein
MTRGEDRSYRTSVLLLLERRINNLSGTDGRPIIAKKASETGRQVRPMKLFLQRASLLYLWIGVGIFYPQSFDIGNIEEANVSTDKDGVWRLIG